MNYMLLSTVQMIELDRQTAMKIQEEEDKSFAELERDAIVASELSQQLNHHHKASIACDVM